MPAAFWAETLGALDCDCLQQLNGALDVISRKPCGVLFYLIQEGRGCGYVGKSRDRQLVQVGASGPLWKAIDGLRALRGSRSFAGPTAPSHTRNGVTHAQWRGFQLTTPPSPDGFGCGWFTVQPRQDHDV